MIQSGDWNTDACTKAGDAVVKLNTLSPYQDGYKAADYNAHREPWQLQAARAREAADQAALELRALAT